MKSIVQSGGILCALCAILLGCSQKPPTPSSIEKPAYVAMSDKIPSGYRGMPLQVPNWEAQFISPGNRIDVIITFDKEHPARPKERTGQTLLQNVLVIDVRPPLHDGESSTLELGLNPNEAQYLALAIDEARTHVVLRGNKDPETHPMDYSGFRKLFK